jgi:hypothetical protein
VPFRSTAHFATSGIAGDLANYILQEHTAPGMDTNLASVIAIKTVKDAIDYVEGCGLPIRVALVEPVRPMPDISSLLSSGRETESAVYPLLNRPSYCLSEPVKIFPQEKVEEIATIILSVEQKAKISQNKKIHKALRSKTEKSFKQMMKEMMGTPSNKKIKK